MNKTREKELTVYVHDKIYRNNNGSFVWASGIGDKEHFDSSLALIHYAKEWEPEVLEQIKEWIATIK